MPRRKMIGVMGSGQDDHSDLAVPLGRWIAAQGYDLLTGGGQGVMAAVSKAFYDVPGRHGSVVGIVPAGRAPGLYPNPWVEVAVFTHLAGADGPAAADSRNHINVLSSDVIVALPGGEGTLSEIDLAVRYSKSVIAYWPGKSPQSKLRHVPVARELKDVQNFVCHTLETSRV